MIRKSVIKKSLESLPVTTELLSVTKKHQKMGGKSSTFDVQGQNFAELAGETGCKIYKDIRM